MAMNRFGPHLGEDVFIRTGLPVRVIHDGLYSTGIASRLFTIADQQTWEELAAASWASGKRTRAALRGRVLDRLNSVGAN